MKIRIHGNFVRLRLNQNEVDKFAQEGTVSEAINFGSHKLAYQLVNKNTQEVEVEFDGSNISVYVPKDLASKWTETDLVGFENTNQQHVRILIEKDFQCLHKRPGEDESDNFPNPAAQ